MLACTRECVQVDRLAPILRLRSRARAEYQSNYTKDDIHATTNQKSTVLKIIDLFINTFHWRDWVLFLGFREKNMMKIKYFFFILLANI